ncbi:MAG: hypothetical protein ACTMIA_13475 [Vibrio sp.]
MKISLPLSTLALAVTATLPFSAYSADSAALDAQIKKVQDLQEQYQKNFADLELLRADYQNKTKQEDGSSYQSLQSLIDRVSIFGFFRAKYDHDDNEPVGSGTNNRHFYMDLQGKMKVSEEWIARFELEARKGYTVNQSWRDGDAGNSDQDGTVQRIWVEGQPGGGVGIALGTKWWGLGFQAVPFGHAADGVQVDYNVTDHWNAKAFWLRPRQGDLVTMPNGQETQISGLNVTGQLVDGLETSLTFATNENHSDDQEMDRMGAIELKMQATPDIMLRTAVVLTNADDYNTSQEYRIDYKEVNLQNVGSYSLYARYFDFERYGDYSHDDEWGSLPADTRGGIIGAKYVLYTNVVWETFYSYQERNRSGELEGMDRKADRNLFRTQIDFHF